ncbi:hypothetical protein [Helicobacter bizzozeronii]|uniref:hypothetical protein n=1 Tax=Helicobacter bizzozeronii TaxID=56877 RepID=UPI0013152B05|nr:hypothetical protein [Helicobacter bizzozeronii]
MAMSLGKAIAGATIGVATLNAMAPLAGLGALVAAGAAGGALVGAVSGSKMDKK